MSSTSVATTVLVCEADDRPLRPAVLRGAPADDLPAAPTMTGMAIEITGFQVNLLSEDIEACAQFYRQLGFEEFYRTPLEGRLE